jgi:hypothetical protein
MTQTNNWIEEYGVAKGYSVRELRQRKVTAIPDNLKDKYSSIDEYFDDIHNYINGL